jgi:hypothetical protein
MAAMQASSVGSSGAIEPADLRLSAADHGAPFDRVDDGHQGTERTAGGRHLVTVVVALKATSTGMPCARRRAAVRCWS